LPPGERQGKHQGTQGYNKENDVHNCYSRARLDLGGCGHLRNGLLKRGVCWKWGGAFFSPDRRLSLELGNREKRGANSSDIDNVAGGGEKKKWNDEEG